MANMKGASQLSADSGMWVEKDPFTLLSRHGFYNELVEHLNTNQDATLKEIGNDVLKAGLLAMTADEVNLACAKWVEKRVVPTYNWMIQNPELPESKALLDKMSPVDHINAILKLLPRHFRQEAAM